jgi:hypothetical protein
MSTPDLPAIEQPVNLWPDPPPKRGRGLGLVISIVALVAVLGGGATAYVLRPSAGDPVAAASPTLTAAAPTRTPAVTPTVSSSAGCSDFVSATYTGYAGNVNDLVLPLPAGGYKAARLTYITPGMSARDQAAAVWHLTDPTPLDVLLSDNNLVAGGLGVWVQGPYNKDDVVIDNVLQFAGPVDAHHWLSDVMLFLKGFDGLTSLGQFGFGGPSDSLVVGTKVTDTDTELYGVFVCGQFGVFMWTGNDSTSPDDAALSNLALAQYELLLSVH